MIPDCAYVGDSIAVGLQQLDPGCAVYAKVGASTDYIAKQYLNAQGANYTVVSMGSNFPLNSKNAANARKLRKSIKSDLVIWILPYNRVAAESIRIVAREFGDSYIDLQGIPSRDHVHPNYHRVNQRIDGALNAYYD
jgi:hypothetical protein